jgi:VanZ family protein
MIRYLWPAIGWSITILILTLIPGKELPDVQVVGIDKVVHVLIFAPLMTLTAFGLVKSSQHLRISHPVLVAFLFSCAFGIMIELIQPFVPGRSFSFLDILANTVGVGLGYVAFVFVRTKYI